ncbi:MAG: right-handed parallel beta-helix repeat-containing protein [Kiritimatiellae bacterium]|nr:right-handed parallel beta-helix repeat-containing protein [Kiritimatiellia bacterium]
MKRGVWGVGVLMAALAVSGAGVQTFYVSPKGDDAAPGTARKPFATFARALEAVKRYKEQTPDGDIKRIEVLFEEGEYPLRESIFLAPDHGGTEHYPVVYRAHSVGHPAVFSGARRITGWKVRDDGAWTVTLPEVKEGRLNFAQLFVNGERRFRPRLPAQGYFRTVDDVGRTEQGIKGFQFNGSDVNPAWASLADVEFMTLHIWSASRMRAASVDPEAHVVTFTKERLHASPWGSYKDRRFWAENVKEAFGKPGTWYLDRPTGELLYQPKPGETPENCTVEAPALDQLLIVQGRPTRPVRHVEMSGLVFRQSGWVTPPEGNFTPQGEMNIPASVEVVGAREVTFDRCVFTQLGGYAFAFGPGAHSNRVYGCVMSDLGAGGVKIGPPYAGYRQLPKPKDELSPIAPTGDANTTSAITIDQCRILHGGRIHPAAHGVWIGHASYNSILHTEIADLYYTAVAIGWTWGYAEPSRSHHNEVGYNHFHAIGQGVLSDMGGVYTLGVSPGTTVHNNRIHNIHAFDYGGWGLYTDEGSTGIAMCSNIVYDVKTGGFHQHYGKENVIENNIFVNSLTDQIQRTRMEDHLSFHFRRNVIYWDNTGILFGMNWSDGACGTKDTSKPRHYELASNLYWHASANLDLFPGKKTLEQWQAETGQDVGSIVADPKFISVKTGDFNFAKDSPVSRIGFRPLKNFQGGPTVKVCPWWPVNDVPTPFY